ncbi:MAG: hypothetical protein ACREWE_09085, partial [Gammaproteobacteria bacterium]
FTLDRYTGLLRQVEVEDVTGLRQILKNMERLSWVKFVGEDEFRFLRPFHRVFDKCLELSQTPPLPNVEANSATPSSTA